MEIVNWLTLLMLIWKMQKKNIVLCFVIYNFYFDFCGIIPTNVGSTPKKSKYL